MAAPTLHHVTSSDGTTIALECVTDGPRPLVTVPGGTAPRAIWAESARALDGRYAVWLADRRGKGDSGDTAPYSFDRDHEDLQGRELLRLPPGTDALRGIGLRTLVLLGERSPDHLRRSTVAVAHALTDVEVVELPGQAHAALQTAPALVGEVLLHHLE